MMGKNNNRLDGVSYDKRRKNKLKKFNTIHFWDYAAFYIRVADTGFAEESV